MHAKSTMEVEQMQGLLMAMTAIGTYTSGHVSTFVSHLEATTRD